jgi:hypothetical protein
VPYWIGALALAAVIIVILVVLEAWSPWQNEMGNDVDGDLATSTSPRKTGLRAQPAE